MKLRIASDLHFECYPGRGAAVSADLVKEPFDTLVIAGDLCSGDYLIPSLRHLLDAADGRPIVYVAGNHEFYKSNRPTVLNVIRMIAQEYPNLHFLENEAKVINGVRFVGSTLWYRLDDLKREDLGFSDFYYIQHLANWLPQEAQDCAKMLHTQVQKGDVVVTHHLPHPSCIHPKYRWSPSNRYFLHDVSPVVEYGGARLWIHGHTHSSVDLTVGETRVVCNPLGYVPEWVASEPNVHFKYDFTVEV